MKKILLSLERDKNRRDLFFTQPPSQGFEVFYAIDAKKQENKDKMLSLFNQQKAKQRYGRTLTLGEIACCLSHIEILKYFLENTNDDYVLICEDDALLSQDFDIIYKILDTQNNDIVLFGESKRNHHNRSISEKLSNPMQFFPKRFGKYRLGMLSGYVWGTVGYAVHRRFAKILIEQKDIFWVADDYQLFSQMSAKIVFLSPRLVIENPNIVSNLEGERSTINAPVKSFGYTKIYKRKIKKLFATLLKLVPQKWEAYQRSKR